MSVYFDEKWLKEYEQRTGHKAQTSGADADSPKRCKYGNERTETDGLTFDSRHEADVWKRLNLETRNGDYIAIARQVPFMLPGGVKYVADFVVFKPDGTYDVLDAKSSATAKNAVYRLKKKQMRECLKIDIKEV